MTRKEYKRNWERDKVKRFREAGVCIKCGKGRAQGSVLCRTHLHDARRRSREKSGSHAWKPGKPGRPPVGRSHGEQANEAS